MARDANKENQARKNKVAKTDAQAPATQGDIAKLKRQLGRRRSGRRSYRTYYYNQQARATDIPGGQSVLSAIMSLIVLIAVMAAIVVCVGPVIDYFGYYMTTLPPEASPYVNAVLPLFPWSYAFMVLTVVVGFVYVYRAVIKQIIYARYND